MSSNDAGVDELTVTRATAHLVTELGGLAERLGVHDFSGLTDDALLEVTTQLERASRRVQALLVLAAGAVSDRSLGVPSESLAGRRGCRDGVELLQRVSLLPGSVLRQRVSIADWLRPMPGYSAGPVPPRYPAVAQAFLAGDLPWESVLLLVKSLGSVPGWVDPARVAVAERCMVNQAAGYPEGYGLSADGAAVLESVDGAGAEAVPPVAGEAGVPLDTDTLRQVCAFWCTALDQDGPEPDDEGQLARRYFRLGRVRNGLVPVRGALLPEVAALLGNLVTGVNSPKTSTNQVDPVSETSTEGAVQPSASGVRFVEGDDPEPVLEHIAGDARSSGQKMHDALMIIAQIAGRAAETPTLGGAPVTVLIQTTQEDLAASLARDLAAATAATIGAGTCEPGAGALGIGEPGADEPGVAWLHGHDGIPVPVSAAAVRHSICSGATQKVLVDGEGRILGISSPTRVFTPHQRRAIAARDGGCIIPGCTVPATWCEVHHVTPWAVGGQTTTENGVLLCWWHHRSIEVSGWHIRMVRGRPEVLAPKWVDPALVWRPARPLLGAAMARTSGRPGRDRTKKPPQPQPQSQKLSQSQSQSQSQSPLQPQQWPQSQAPVRPLRQ